MFTARERAVFIANRGKQFKIELNNLYLQYLNRFERNGERIIEEIRDPFEDLDDIQFQRRFRLKKETATSVLNMIEEQLEFPTGRNHPITPRNHLLAGLRFYAT